jgi:hypothetical protein
MKKAFLLVSAAILGLAAPAQENLLAELLRQSGDSLLEQVLRQPLQHQLQVIYTQIDRDADNRPSFKSYTHGLDPQLYFYPASTVKMPTAFLALEKLNELSIAGLDKNTPMLTGAGRPPQTAALTDSTAANGLPSVAHYVKKIFLVSDNDAHNRLYEFLGQEELNRRLYEKGYRHSRIIHRLSVSGFDAEGNRYVNPIQFVAGDAVVYEQGESYSAFYPNLPLKEQVRGLAYLDNDGQIVPEPFDFRFKNYVALQDLHDMLQAIIFPEAVPPQRRFKLTEEDYRFLWKYMSIPPKESDYPAYPPDQYWDSYVKFFMFGDSKDPLPPHIRIFNKVGIAYGFITDVAYVVDFATGVEFLLSATLHVNRNQTYNDGVYEYDEIGYPTLARLGRLIYEFERKRPRPYPADLSRYRF